MNKPAKIMINVHMNLHVPGLLSVPSLTVLGQSWLAASWRSCGVGWGGTSVKAAYSLRFFFSQANFLDFLDLEEKLGVLTVLVLLWWLMKN